MKYLKILCAQADVPLAVKYYYPYLNNLEQKLLEAIAQKRKSTPYILNLFRSISLQILFLLQHSACLWGESRWQSLLAASQAELGNRNLISSQQLRKALLQADEVISMANVTETVRKKIWLEVKNHAALSDLQAQRYESARQACLTQQLALNDCEFEINTCIRDYHQLAEHVTPLNKHIPAIEPYFFTCNSSLRPYDAKTTQARLSIKNIHHQIEREGNARIVYQNLIRELEQKSAVETMAEAVEHAKRCLQDRAENMQTKTDHYRRHLLQQTRLAIEHRTQINLAHANRIERISLLLAILIHIAQSHDISQCRPLLSLVDEADMMQKQLQQNSCGADLQERVLTLNAHRIAYEKSITSFWRMRLTKPRQLNHLHQLNHQLQMTLADIVTPICGFNDKNQIIASNVVKKIKITSDKLGVYQGRLFKAQEKTNQIENIFSS